MLESTLYITEPGTVLRTRGERVRVVRKDQQLLYVPYDRLPQIVCTARLVGPASTDVALRHAQHCLADKEAAALELACAFVSGKIANMRACLLRAARAG